jgi:hypothetical protein
VTGHGSPYYSEEEVDAWFAQEVAIEHDDFIDEILEESSNAIQMATDTQQAINRDSNANSGGGSNGTDILQAISRDSNTISGGDSNTISGGDSNANQWRRVEIRCFTSSN